MWAIRQLNYQSFVGESALLLQNEYYKLALYHDATKHVDAMVADNIRII